MIHTCKYPLLLIMAATVIPRLFHMDTGAQSWEVTC